MTYTLLRIPTRSTTRAWLSVALTRLLETSARKALRVGRSRISDMAGQGGAGCDPASEREIEGRGRLERD